jgi:hypothetical protein
MSNNTLDSGYIEILPNNECSTLANLFTKFYNKINREYWFYNNDPSIIYKNNILEIVMGAFPDELQYEQNEINKTKYSQAYNDFINNKSGGGSKKKKQIHKKKSKKSKKLN